MPRRSSTPKTARNPGRRASQATRDRNPRGTKKEFPYREKDDTALMDGAQVARARYHREARADALGIFKEAQALEDEDERREFIEEKINEHADDATKTTPDALAIVMQSDRWTAMGDAIDEGTASMDGVTDVSEMITKIAFWAYRQDLLEYIEAFENVGVEGAEENPSHAALERYTPSELRNMPTLSEGHTDNLKVEEKIGGVPTRIWLSRMTVEDGETHAVHVEQLRDGRWEVVHSYGRPKRYKEMFENPSGGQTPGQMARARSWDGSNFHSAETARQLGDSRFRYVPFHALTANDQRQAVATYVHKSVGGKYDFRDEHYYYPVNKDGRLTTARAQRVLAIPRARLDDDAYMSSLGYEINEGWR